MMKIDIAKQQELLRSIDNIRSFIEHLPVQKSCSSCKHWSGGGYTDKWKGKCKLVDKTPPLMICETGCEQWELWDEIPY